MSRISSYTTDTPYELNRIESMATIDNVVQNIETIQTKLAKYEQTSGSLNQNYNTIVETRDAILAHPVYLKYPSLKKKDTLADIMHKDTIVQTHSNNNLLILSGIAIATLMIVSATR